VTNSVLAPPLVFQGFGLNGQIASGGLLYTYLAGTSTPTATYPNATSVIPNTNPIVLNSLGQAEVWLVPGQAYKFNLTDANGNQIPNYPVDNVIQGSSGSSPTNPVFPITPAEQSAGVTIVNGSYEPGNVLRYGLIPNVQADSAANAAILVTLLNYNTVGPTGLIWFPNTTGQDIYWVQGVCTIRPGVQIDGMGCTIQVTGSSASTEVNTGFFYILSDVTIQNMTIITAVQTSAGVNAAACIEVGARGASTWFPSLGSGVYDSLLPAGKSQGRVIVRNVTLSCLNTGGQSNHVIDMTGGLSNVLFENITIACNNVQAINGIYYEWGWATFPSGASGGVAAQTSHGHNMVFTNIRVANSNGSALGLTGAYNSTVNELYSGNCVQTFVYSVGEAMFYNPWIGVDTYGAKRNITLNNIVGQGTTGTGIQLAGSNPAVGTYLHAGGVTLTPAQQTDLMSFIVDGFAVPSLSVSGNITARNGKLDGGGTVQNPLTLIDDLRYARFENTQVLNGTGSGIRADIAGIGVWIPPRLKYIEIDGGLVAGNTVSGIEINNVQACRLTDVQFGYNALNDGQGNETTQTVAVLVDIGADGVICDSCVVTTPGAGTYGSGPAYSITGTTSSGCNVINPMGNPTTQGAWETNGVASASNTTIATAASALNSNYKYYGKECIDSSTGKVFVSQGPNPTSSWISTDGVTTITPS
jgi:hypothetical protein